MTLANRIKLNSMVDAFHISYKSMNLIKKIMDVLINIIPLNKF